MKAILSKEAGGYDLYRINEDGKRVTFASTQDYKQKLSLKNCQAIERGYDLDELISKTDTSHLAQYTSDSHELMFDEGFKLEVQAILKILDDKKFTEREAFKIWKAGQEYWKTSGESITFEELIERKSELLQQTEWEVEVEMEYYDTLPPTRQTGLRPKLDANGCLVKCRNDMQTIRKLTLQPTEKIYRVVRFKLRL